MTQRIARFSHKEFQYFSPDFQANLSWNVLKFFFKQTSRNALHSFNHEQTLGLKTPIKTLIKVKHILNALIASIQGWIDKTFYFCS